MARKPATEDTQAPAQPVDASAGVPAPETDRPGNGAEQAGTHEANPAAPGGTAPSGGPFTVTVVGPAKGRWRAGRHFGPAPQLIAVADLTEAELAAIMADPELVTSVA